MHRSKSIHQLEENRFYRTMIDFADEIVIRELGHFAGTKKAAWDIATSSSLSSSPQAKAWNDLIDKMHREKELNYPALMDRARIVLAMLAKLSEPEFMVFVDKATNKVIDREESMKLKSLAPVQLFMYLERRRNTDLDPAVIYQKVTEENPLIYKNYMSLVQAALPEKKNK